MRETETESECEKEREREPPRTSKEKGRISSPGHSDQALPPAKAVGKQRRLRGFRKEEREREAAI